MTPTGTYSDGSLVFAPPQATGGTACEVHNFRLRGSAVSFHTGAPQPPMDMRTTTERSYQAYYCAWCLAEVWVPIRTYATGAE